MKITQKLLLFCFILSVSSAFAQRQGKVIEEQTVKSRILKRNVKYTIYLPADYETANRSYPVVYLLHGYTDDNTGWLQFGEINRYADKAIAEGTIPPMVIVMPNADSSWYINSYDGKEKYEDFFIKEFMPDIEKAYRIKTEKKYRGVAGLSMGGYGTLIYALKYPQLFAAGAALSAAVLSDEQITDMPDANWEKIFGQLYGRELKGKDRLTKAWQDNSVLGLVQGKTTEQLSSVRYWIDCGDDDGLSRGNSLLHIALMEKKVAHEFRVRDGAHNWTYWRTGITNALQFIGDSFRQK
ncbi:alpha/beta hydrolase-fold protein [Mucilaginibacter sabulilitoris]|uniref:Alpha/beta hydrolase-fold protein n=1 Tax=Mucilaginibacter sabulilitoris TaxID=1173583 RepID=A0ABZ0TT82_9SPHI|nr:alpha/beta hydrolase-fold protein [Mucilaginibacter sabulilitoris]WPU95976.1 alpha/beta hydrolase-fold protein [Mucilaginibacter sabulilitoris]